MVHDPQNISPEEQVAAAKQRLRQATQRMGQDLGQTADELQARAVETVQGVRGEIEDTADHLQERLEQTLSTARQQVSDTAAHLREQAQQLGQEVGSALKQPIEGIRKHPWEAVAGAVIIGLLVGELSSGGAAPRHSTANSAPSHKTSTDSGTDSDRKAAGDGSSHQRTRTVYASAAAGLGQTVWEVLRQDYLNPQQIRQWLHGLLGQPRPSERETP